MPRGMVAADMKQQRRPNGHWTQERVIEAVQRWATEHGTPPSADEWTCSGPYWPSKNTLLGKFGSWNAIIVAAGLEPAAPGQYHNPSSRSDVMREVWAKRRASELAFHAAKAAPRG